MKLILSLDGIGFQFGEWVCNLFWRDVYIKVPFFGELAWNSTGFTIDRY